MVKIGIFGSCVSRDTAEFIPEAEVEVYVARHSFVSLVAPHGVDGVRADRLHSNFQRRMLQCDLTGDGINRVAEKSNDLDLVILDLVDERRGFWLFPDGTTATNSIEFEKVGGIEYAESQGARLIRFGTSEHFTAWKIGLNRLIRELTEANLIDRTLFLDLEWAGTFEGMPQPRNDLVSLIGRRYRKVLRGTRTALRAFSQKKRLPEIWHGLIHVEPTAAEVHLERAVFANRIFARYGKELRRRVSITVTRKSHEMRIDPNHKWGPQPFHYSKMSYENVAKEVVFRAEIV